nr:MAG TPA: putative internal virion protein B [Bacteriophage sp.]
MSGVVIGVGAAVGAVTFGGGSIYGMNKQNRNALAAFKKQMKYLQTNYNYNQAALDRQERSMYDNALGELFTLSLNAYQNNAQVEAAIAETGLGGRSQEKIEQTVRGQTARQETATKEAYMMDVWNVRSQKDALYIQTKASVEQARDNLNNNLIYGSKAFQQFLGSTLQGAAVGAATAGFIGSATGAIGAGATTSATGAGAATGVDAISGAAPTVAKGASTGSLGVLIGAGATAGGAIGTAMQQAASTTAQSTASQTGSFMSRMTANYQQYKPYVDFVQQWADYYNHNLTPKKQRGGYFY